MFLRLHDVFSSALYEEKRSRITAAALTFDGRHEVKLLVSERILSNRSFCFMYACFKAWFLSNWEVFLQMLSVFFIFISIGLRSVNPLGIKLKKNTLRQKCNVGSRSCQFYPQHFNSASLTERSCV